MFVFDWDDEDDDEDDEEEDDDDEGGVDNEDPYGEDENPDGGDDEGQAEGDKKEGKSEEKAAGKVEGKTKKPNTKKMIAMAKSMGIPSVILPVPCPKCHQNSLFFEKKSATAIRITRMILQGCIGAVNMSEIPGVVRFVCLNPKCKSYYKPSGDKFKIGAGGRLELTKNYFHVNL